MTFPTFILDPTAVASAYGRTQLDLNNVQGVRVKSVDWGDAAFAAFAAQDQVWGSVPVEGRRENRTVTVTLGLGMDESGSGETKRSQLQQKIKLFQDEGGWLLRQRTGVGVAMYADVVNVTGTIPDVTGEMGAGLEDDVVLTFECLPDFYGDEITLGTMSSTGLMTSVIKTTGGSNASILGDYPARCRLKVSDTSGNQQNGLIAGLRSRYYDSASTAATYLPSTALFGLNGAASVVDATAKSGHRMALTLPATSDWVPFTLLASTSGGGALTHLGAYRVYARVPGVANMQYRLLWAPGDLAVPVENDPVTVPGSDAFYMMDLGEIILNRPPVGSPGWLGVIQAAGSGLAASVDYVLMLPVDDGACYLSAGPAATPAGTLSQAAGLVDTQLADTTGTGTVAWADSSSTWFATSTTAAVSHYLVGSNLGFSIPTGATILGVELAVEQYTDSPAGFTMAVTDNIIKLVKAGSVAGNNKAKGSLWSAAPKTVTYGGASDLWGTTLTPSDVNNTGFGFAISVNLPAETHLGGRTVVPFAKLDAWTVTVNYRLASGFVISQDAVIYPNKSVELRTESHYRSDPNGVLYSPVHERDGSYLRLPPAGVENRPCELVVKPIRGSFSDEDPNQGSSPGLDAFTVQVLYRPCWLSRP